MEIFSITKNGKPLDPLLYTIDNITKTFTSNEQKLIVYCLASNWKFNTGNYCTFDTGNDCTFETGSNCIFNTGSNCTFKTGFNCTFKTWFNAFIKCKDESPICIRYISTNKRKHVPKSVLSVFSNPNQLMYIENGDITIWENKDLILNCKDSKFKDACNFFMKKEN